MSNATWKREFSPRCLSCKVWVNSYAELREEAKGLEARGMRYVIVHGVTNDGGFLADFSKPAIFVEKYDDAIDYMIDLPDCETDLMSITLSPISYVL